MSSSILTNQSAITALQALRLTQQTLASTQKEISTGLKVSSAADNASTWSISQTMKSDQGVLSTISDSLAVSGSLLNVGTAAVNNAITVLNNIKSAVAQAEDPSADQAKILTNLQALGKQLTSIVASASFNGQNLIDGSGAATYSIVASYTDGKGTAASSVGTISLTTQALTNAGNTGMLQAAQATGSGAATDFTNLAAADLASGTIADTLSNADKAIASLTSYSANIGATYTSVQAQGSFIKTLNDALTSGVSSLVDADMNEASTKLQALQTQQQLGVQSLSIANQNSQIIMRLFQ
jgi:flagellin